MQISYCSGTDSLLVIVSEQMIFSRHKICEDIIIQHDAQGNLASILIQNASNRNKFNLKDHIVDLEITKLAIVTHVKRNMEGVDNKIIKNYFKKHKITKLNIGCGRNIIDGWLNSDYYPQSEQILHLDATAQFPFENDKLDYIFSEHTIEHLTYLQGMNMLKECCRVLKPGGKLRISTPDLSFLIHLYDNQKSVLIRKYVKWAKEMFLETAPCFEEIFVINNFVRAWGHKFIYDKKLLHYCLEQAGFEEIISRDLNESMDEELRYVEHTARMPAEFLRMESIILEAMKPTYKSQNDYK